MSKMIKRLPIIGTIVAVIFLMIQVAADLYLPTLTVAIVNNGIIGNKLDYILKTGGLMILLAIISFFAAELNTYISSKISHTLGQELRQEVFDKTLEFSGDELNKFGASSLITRTTNDVTQVQTLVEMGLKFLIIAPLYLFGGLYFSYRLSPELAKVFFWVVPFIGIVLIGISLYANPLYTKMQNLIDKLNLVFREGLTGVRVIRAFRKEDTEFKRYEDSSKEYAQVSVQAGSIMSLLYPSVMLSLGLATLMITWLGGKEFLAGNMEVGTIMGIVSYSTQILTGLSILTSVIASVPRGQTSAKRINEVLETSLSITDKKDMELYDDHTPCDTLIFDNVTYGYEGAEKKALKDISFSVNKGEKLAIVGSTGSGKSTLIQLIHRAYDVESGEICLGGQDIREYPLKELQKKIAVTPQRSKLFYGTIRDNMAMANLEETDEEIWEALAIGDAKEFVKEKEQGLDSLVEKNGSNFSGGQKQRLCIARTLLKPSSVVIFDDSFSALDFSTDAKVRCAMSDSLKDKITIVIAQRISTVMDADKILVLDDGEMVGLGTHEELKESNRVYQEIMDSQLQKEVAA